MFHPVCEMRGDRSLFAVVAAHQRAAPLVSVVSLLGDPFEILLHRVRFSPGFGIFGNIASMVHGTVFIRNKLIKSEVWDSLCQAG